jgi:hypothetical protein
LTQPAPRVVVALTRLAKHMHPEAMTDIPQEWSRGHPPAIRSESSETVAQSPSVSSRTADTNGPQSKPAAGSGGSTVETTANNSILLVLLTLVLTVLSRRWFQN